MSNLNINKVFGSVFIVVVLLLFAFTFIFLIGHKVGSNTVKSEVLWSHGDFSVSETQVAYAGTETEITSETNNILTPVIWVDARVFCPVCQEKGLKSCVYEGSTTSTLVYNPTWYDEDGNKQYVNTNTSTTYYSCSEGHEWYEAYCMGETRIEIIKDTEDEEIDSSADYDDDYLEQAEDENIPLLANDTLESTIEIGEMVLYRYETIGEWASEFKPTIFLDVVNTDVSGCIVDGRLRLRLDGEIYWIRIEKDGEYFDDSEKTYIFGNVTKVVE